jgi:Putative zinc binding domain
MNNAGNCRFCSGSLSDFVDLGMSPPCESYLTEDQLNAMEPFYPLIAYVCRDCLLVQLQEYVAPKEIFSEYAYFSAYSDAWLDHARRYAEMMCNRLGLGPASQVIELGSNDGYLLQFFVEKGVPVLGIDPAANVARAPEKRGVPTLVEFFGIETARALAEAGKQADLVVGNNVLTQVADGRGLHYRVSPPFQDHRRKPVRPDLSRAFFHTSRLLPPIRYFVACSTLMSYGRTAARCVSRCATPVIKIIPRKSPSPSCFTASARPACTDAAATHAPRGSDQACRKTAAMRGSDGGLLRGASSRPCPSGSGS